MEQQSKLKFSYTNRFGNESTTEETFDEETLNEVGENTLDYIIERFKAFLIFAQFHETTVNKINYNNEEI